MSHITLESILISNYRSYGNTSQEIFFPDARYNKPITITGYNNAGKTTLMNAILHSLNIKFVQKDTFSISDFHNRDIENIPHFMLKCDSSEEIKFDGGKKARLKGYHKLTVITDGNEIDGSKIESFNSLELISNGGAVHEDVNWQAFGATRYFNIFHINFHEIKKEISTKKSGRGNLTSFLGRHIQKITEEDQILVSRKQEFSNDMKIATQKALEGTGSIHSPGVKTKLSKFIESIKINYKNNLRSNACEVQFALPNYEDIFLQMMFNIGLNGDKDNLVPVDHFGDGYVSIFVMAVLQAIAETNITDKCLFLFEEPESFLHENHQEYFYKKILCKLAQKHQVIYTTHSDKMLNIFDTRGLIRLDFDSEQKQTVVKYNKAHENYIPIIESDPLEGIPDYNNYIKSIEPNLNKIIFSKKVIFVEGPNDLMVYSELIKNILVKEFNQEEDFAETYLNFHNIVIIPHHGKGTVYCLADLCNHLGIEYFIITDLDFDFDYTINSFSYDDLISENIWSSISQQKDSKGEEYSPATIKKMLTINRNIKDKAGEKIHFNIKKLETVIGYNSDDKDSSKIRKTIKSSSFSISENLFPYKLKIFLEFDKITILEK